MFRAMIFASVFGSRKEARGLGEGLRLVIARFIVKQVELLRLITHFMIFSAGQSLLFGQRVESSCPSICAVCNGHQSKQRRAAFGFWRVSHENAQYGSLRALGACDRRKLIKRLRVPLRRSHR